MYNHSLGQPSFINLVGSEQGKAMRGCLGGSFKFVQYWGLELGLIVRVGHESYVEIKV